MPTNHDELVAARNAEYDDAWRRTSRWMIENWAALGKLGDAVFPIVMIHNKIDRILGTLKRDSTDDIIGYAKLVLIVLEELEQAKQGPWSVPEDVAKEIRDAAVKLGVGGYNGQTGG